jgi:hypothetical protein
MKLVVGYILAFLSMTLVAGAMAFGVFLFSIIAIAFITWSLPLVPIAWWTALRLCVVFSAFIGIWFICSKEGQDYAKEFANETNCN